MHCKLSELLVSVDSVFSAGSLGPRCGGCQGKSCSRGRGARPRAQGEQKGTMRRWVCFRSLAGIFSSTLTTVRSRSASSSDNYRSDSEIFCSLDSPQALPESELRVEAKFPSDIVRHPRPMLSRPFCVKGGGCGSCRSGGRGERAHGSGARIAGPPGATGLVLRALVRGSAVASDEAGLQSRRRSRWASVPVRGKRRMARRGRRRPKRRRGRGRKGSGRERRGQGCVRSCSVAAAGERRERSSNGRHFSSCLGGGEGSFQRHAHRSALGAPLQGRGRRVRVDCFLLYDLSDKRHVFHGSKSG